jgi:mannose-6-phosphate isomerase
MTHDDLFQYQPVQRISKPWGYELIIARTGRYVGKILHINKGESLSLQYHEMKEESLYVLHGKIALTVEFDGDRRVIPLAEGQAFHVPPRLIHRMEAIEDTDISEVSTTELDDVVRLEDRYGRVEERS